MSADILLQHLNKVKRTRSGTWLACCPSHNDKTASLSIRELDDGRLLVHCFAGCNVNEIVESVGLTLSDLFPPPETSQRFSKGERRPFPAADILRAILGEAKIVYMGAKHISGGNPLSGDSLKRLLLAVSRIQAALIAGGIQ
jgi:hypothetical protein